MSREPYINVQKNLPKHFLSVRSLIEELFFAYPFLPLVPQTGSHCSPDQIQAKDLSAPESAGIQRRPRCPPCPAACSWRLLWTAGPGAPEALWNIPSSWTGFHRLGHRWTWFRQKLWLNSGDTITERPVMVKWQSTSRCWWKDKIPL